MIDFYFDDDKAGERLARLGWTACSGAGRGMQRQPWVGTPEGSASQHHATGVHCSHAPPNSAHATFSCFVRLPRGF